ncbi:hypothetical protein SAMN05421780_105160 [Flexibacter flexilis DSM 6793]|uniref:DUF2255 family protein n=1 Tax=Flexibacter flexilis DSM 6793 TaxID=927664 RepID=A0A1I1J0K3_9BACT|nr:DUF2255 family protein [Flexibacter flexilis]SFC42099.1 hypothetical protein SAMN05421780_105160 [Flexibacter flexilis DSM 6793]
MITSNLLFSAEELAAIIQADDLKISPFRTDGVSYGTPTWIWAVAVEGQLYVRAYHGKNSRWYQAAIAQKAGRIHAAQMVKNVAFEPVADSSLNDRINEAYKQKYSGSPYLPPMISGRANEATIRIIPIAS